MNNLSDQTVLLIGSNGFVGLHLLRSLMSIGKDVHVIQRAAGTQGAPHGPHVWPLDLTDGAALSRAICAIRPSIVFLAATSRAEENWQDLCAVNIKASMTLLEACKDNGVRRLVTLGSALELCDVPPSAYAASRLAGALLMQCHASKWDIALTHIRTGYVYGRGMAARKFIPSAIKAAMQDTEIAITPDHITRNYVHVDDIVDACLAAAQGTGAGVHAVNAVNQTTNTAREVTGIIAAHLGRPVTIRVAPQLIRDWDQQDDNIDPTGAQQLFGWHPRVSLRDGLKDLIEQARGQAGC